MFKNDARFTHSGDPEGRRALALVKPDAALFAPKPGDHLFKGAQQIPEKGQRGPFRLGLPEKEISLPDPLVQQAIARTLAGVSSKGFQLLTPKTMAEVNQLAKTPAARSPLQHGPSAGTPLADHGPDSVSGAVSAEEASEDEGVAPAQGAEGADRVKATEPSESAEDTQGKQDAEGVESAEALAAAQSSEDTGVAAADGRSDPAQDGGRLAIPNEEAESSKVSEASEESEKHLAEDSAQADEAASEDITAKEVDAKATPPNDGQPSPAAVPPGMQLVSAEDIQQMFDEAFAQGKQAGLEEAQATAVSAATVAEQERQAIEDEAYQKGYDEGHAKADAVVRDELQAEVQLVVEDLRDLTQKMAEAAHDTNNFYAPLLKLATHLAEQLVRGELTLSGQAIARLVQTSLEEFDKDPSAPVLVRLNPEDLARIEGHGLSLPGSMTFKPDPTLTSGSVKVQMNGALIEDLIEDRAAALWHSLTAQVDAGAPPPSFLQNVALVKEAFDEVDSVIETADPDDYEDAATEPAVESRGV